MRTSLVFWTKRPHYTCCLKLSEGRLTHKPLLLHLGRGGGASLGLSRQVCFCPCHLDESGTSVSWSNSTVHLPCSTWEPRAQKSRYDFIIPALQEHCPWILNFVPLFLLALSYPTAIMWLTTLYEHHQDILLPEKLLICLWHKLTGCVISLGSRLALSKEPLQSWRLDLAVFKQSSK